MLDNIALPDLMHMSRIIKTARGRMGEGGQS